MIFPPSHELHQAEEGMGNHQIDAKRYLEDESVNSDDEGIASNHELDLLA